MPARARSTNALQKPSASRAKPRCDAAVSPLPAHRGARSIGSGRGIAGIAERVHLFGGTVTAGPTGTPAAEWVLRAEIPVAADHE